MIAIGITIGIAIIVVIAADIYLELKGGFQATFSWWMYTNSVKYPIIPAAIGLIVGLLMGHFFWDQSLNVTVPCAVTQ